MRETREASPGRRSLHSWPSNYRQPFLWLRLIWGAVHEGAAARALRARL